MSREFKCYSEWISLIWNFEFTKLIRDKVLFIELSQLKMPYTVTSWDLNFLWELFLICWFWQRTKCSWWCRFKTTFEMPSRKRIFGVVWDIIMDSKATNPYPIVWESMKGQMLHISLLILWVLKLAISAALVMVSSCNGHWSWKTVLLANVVYYFNLMYAACFCFLYYGLLVHWLIFPCLIYYYVFVCTWIDKV